MGRRCHGARCCMPQCNTNTARCRGLSFCRLPKKGVSVPQDKWREALIRSINRVDQKFNPVKAKICSRHFEEGCIRYGLSGRCLGLILGSLPTRWMPSKSAVTPKNSVKILGPELIAEEENETELSEVKIQIDIAEEPSEYWVTDQPPRDTLIENAVKTEPGCGGNVLDSGCTCHEVEPMVVKTEVKEETDTDLDVKPALSYLADTTAAERGQDITRTVYNSRERKTTGNVMVNEVKTEVKEETHELKMEGELPACSGREQEPKIVQTSSDLADPPTSTSTSCSETVPVDKIKKIAKRCYVYEVCSKSFRWISSSGQKDFDKLPACSDPPTSTAPSCSETVAGDEKLSERRHVCEVCCKEFRLASLLKSHMVCHSGRKNFVCDICNKAFVRFGDLKKHKFIHSGRKDFVCDICNKAFVRFGYLKKHKFIHSDRKDFVCDICNKAFVRFGDLKNHKFVHSDRKDFVCDICNKGFTMAGSLRIHKLMCSGQRNFACEVCNKAFVLARHLKKHMSVHTGRKDFVCEVCGKAFNEASNMRRHMLIHSGQKDFVCDICNRGFTQRSTLKNHKLICTGQKEFVCYGCNKVFIRAKRLKSHMSVCTGQKDFVCDVCGKVFSLARYMKRHKLIHLDRKDFVCDICNRGFTQASSLKTHKLIHTGQKD